MTSSHQGLLALFRGYLDASPSDIVAQFVKGTDWAMEERRLDPCLLPCLRHLARIAAIAGEAGAPLARTLAGECDGLFWGQTYSPADFGVRFMENYGWLELFGARGHFVNDAMAGGALLLGPHTHYPDHHHVAEEIYLPLTGGAEWRMDGQPFAPRRAGEVIHHGSNVAHAMRTGVEPLLALYQWRGGPLDQRSTIDVEHPG